MLLNKLCNCIIIALFFIFITGINALNKYECSPRDYNEGSIICVCNIDHCDVVEPVGTFSKNEFLIYSSNKNGKRFNRTVATFDNKPIEYDVRIEIGFKRRYQRIIGWGGAFTDAVGINLDFLTDDVKEKLLRSYYSDDGLEYTLGRVPIGGTDFSTRPYAYDEFDGDVDLTKFNLTTEDHQYKIPLIRKAMEMSNQTIKLVASAWSAPAWMKTNNDLTGFGFLKSNLYQTWANYHVKFLDFYSQEGVNFWALTTGNEPVNGVIPLEKFNSMGWTPSTMSKYISENLGPTIKASQFSETKIIALDDQRFFLPWWPKALFSNNVTKSFIDGIGVHWYWDHVTPAQLLSLTHYKFPEKFILYTEACIVGLIRKLTPVILGSWERAEDYISTIVKNVNHWTAGWIDWNLALDLKGGPNWAKNFVDSPIIVNTTSNEFYKQPLYYAFGHIAKFVPPDSTRIHHTQSNSKLEVVSFETPNNQIVLVLVNTNNDDLLVSIAATKQQFININIEKRSVNTIIFNL